jgi:hypothetical protein
MVYMRHNTGSTVCLVEVMQLVIGRSVDFEYVQGSASPTSCYRSSKNLVYLIGVHGGCCQTQSIAYSDARSNHPFVLVSDLRQRR